MGTTAIISIAAFCGPFALIMAVALLLRDRGSVDGLHRLDKLAGRHQESAAISLMDEPQKFQKAWLNHIEKVLTRLVTLNHLVDQAGVKLTTTSFFALCGISGTLGTGIALIVSTPLPMVPAVGVFFAAIPLIWLLQRRKQRLRKFSLQFPDALELISRGLRSGHSLAASLQLVSQEMLPPISYEFDKACRQQQLGVSVVDSIEDVARRIPNEDLKFFHTSVKMQQRFGGNLAEILDTISTIVRERFQILGQVQALTGEGRLSGIVLLLLPLAIFLGLYYLSPGYVMPLFTDPLGKRMLGVAIMLQLVGAFTIKKIINIKI